MIALDVRLPLARFTLAVDVTLGGDGVTAVMGPSGAGKTSLLEAVAGLRRAAHGRVVVGDAVWQDGRTRRPPEQRRVGYVPQDAGLFPHLSARANVAFGARVDAARLAEIVDTLELGPLLARRPGTLSGGERQRVALARALAHAPALLLLDEPLGALDVALRERIVPWLLRLRASWQVPVLWVTHQVGEALALADTALLLRDGRVVAQGAPGDLLGIAAGERDGGVENLLPATIMEHDVAGGISRVRLGDGLGLSIPLHADRPPGSAVTLGVRAEDVLIAIAPVQGLSARNVVAATVLDVTRAGADALVRCVPAGGSAWLVRCTPAAVADLRLHTGRPVWLALKSHSVRVA
ncbi:MAG: molybdenum ABC transporter ATP-binding protein [bacterium]|nr:molybdenum ABC transporter ATP-binding protein [bacterium]